MFAPNKGSKIEFEPGSPEIEFEDELGVRPPSPRKLGVKTFSVFDPASGMGSFDALMPTLHGLSVGPVAGPAELQK